jgi:AcrR family transcriptional regulator
MSPKVTEEYKEKRRLEILQVAKKVFTEKGYEPTTMKDIVEQSGLSRGGVYQYFSSTEEIFRGIVDLGDQSSLKEFNELIESSPSIWESLMSLIEEYRTVPTENFGAVQFEYTVTGWRDEARLAYIIDRSKIWRNTFYRFLEEGVTRGEFNPKQPLGVITDFILNVQDGLLLYHRVGGRKVVDIDGQIDALIFYLKGALLGERN